MSDDDIIRPTCGQCGAELLVEQIGPEPEPEDRVSCPNHGFICTRQEVRQLIADQAREQIGDALRRALKGGGFDIR